MHIVLKTIPHSEQRYETVGDYQTDRNGHVTVTVSDMGHEDYAFLVAVHELVEAWLCARCNITDAKITGFDVAFEAARKEGDTSEPGDEPDAPYQNAHCIATAVERLLCGCAGISWKEYEKAVLELSK